MVLFLEPEFKERIWGGTGLKAFNYDIPSDITGNVGAFRHIQMDQIRLRMVDIKEKH